MKKQKANAYELHHTLKNKKRGKSKAGAHFADLELAYLESIIELSEVESIDAHLTDTEQEDIMEHSNLHTSSFLDCDKPHHHESITDIANSLQVEITEEDIEEPVFET